MTVSPRRESQPRENVVNKQKVKSGVVWSQWSSVLGYAVLCSYRTKVQPLTVEFLNQASKSHAVCTLVLYEQRTAYPKTLLH